MRFWLLLHLFGVVIWVGGMFFAYVALRPVAAGVLEPAQRLRLWAGVLGIFFHWVWAAVGLILASGLVLWLVYDVNGPYVHVMFTVGLAMVLLFAHVYFAPYRRLTRAVGAADWQRGGQALGQIRKLVAVNLTLGLLVIVDATVGYGLGG